MKNFKIILATSAVLALFFIALSGFIANKKNASVAETVTCYAVYTGNGDSAPRLKCYFTTKEKAVAYITQQIATNAGIYLSQLGWGDVLYIRECYISKDRSDYFKVNSASLNNGYADKWGTYRD